MKLNTKDFEERMGKSIYAYEQNIGSVRAGQASTAVLSKINFEYWGAPTALMSMADVRVADSKTVTITPYDATTLKAMEKAPEDRYRNTGEMIADIEKILEYQKLDFVLYKANKDFANSEENKRAQMYRKLRNDLAESLIRLDKEAGENFNDIDKAITSYENFVKKLKATNLSAPKTIEQADKNEETINALISELNAIQKDIQKCFARLQEIDTKDAKEVKQKIGKVLSELKNAEIIRNDKRNEIISSISQEGAALNKMQSELAPEDLKIYNKVKSSVNRMPYIVEYRDGNCLGCGIEIKSEVDAKLQKSGDTAECPHCRRIVYKK